MSFGFWYLVFWMVTAEQNPLLWSLFAKIVFVLFGISWHALLTDRVLEK